MVILRTRIPPCKLLSVMRLKTRYNDVVDDYREAVEWGEQRLAAWASGSWPGGRHPLIGPTEALWLCGSVASLQIPGKTLSKWCLRCRCRPISNKTIIEKRKDNCQLLPFNFDFIFSLSFYLSSKWKFIPSKVLHFFPALRRSIARSIDDPSIVSPIDFSPTVDRFLQLLPIGQLTTVIYQFHIDYSKFPIFPFSIFHFPISISLSFPVHRCKSSLGWFGFSLPFVCFSLILLSLSICWLPLFIYSCFVLDKICCREEFYWFA